MRFLQSGSFLAVLAVTAISLLFGGHAVAEGFTIKHKQGETALAGKPERVLVFDLAVLDTLAELGVEPAGVPRGPKPDYLKAYDEDKYLKVGTLIEPDYEAVSAARPDLIIVAARTASKYPQLARIAPTIDLTVDANNYLVEAKKNVATLAEIFDKEKEGEALLAELDTSIADLKALASTKGKGLLILTLGGKMAAFGPGSRFDMLYDAFGVEPAAETEHAGLHGQAVSFEYILQVNPDWLFVVDRDTALNRQGEAAAQYLDNEVIRRTKAWQDGRVVYLDSDLWYLAGTGPGAIRQMVAQLASALGKD